MLQKIYSTQTLRMPENKTVFVISGPTAVGKTTLCINLAQKFSSEIISADSRQFYREIPIGTAAPSPDELAAVPHHFIGHLSVTDVYNAYQFELDALNLAESLFSNHKVIFLTGGSGLYLHAFCYGIDELPDASPDLREWLNDKYKSEGINVLQEMLRHHDPVYFQQVDQQNPARLIRALEVCLQTGQPYSEQRKSCAKPRPFRILKVGLYREREDLNRRIEERVHNMMAAGLVREVESMIPFRSLPALKTVGYKEIFDYFNGKYKLEEAIEKIIVNTRKYAKRQMTWLKRDPEILWFHPDEYESLISYIDRNQ